MEDGKITARLGGERGHYGDHRARVFGSPKRLENIAEAKPPPPLPNPQGMSGPGGKADVLAAWL